MHIFRRISLVMPNKNSEISSWLVQIRFLGPKSVLGLPEKWDNTFNLPSGNSFSTRKTFFFILYLLVRIIYVDFTYIFSELHENHDNLTKDECKQRFRRVWKHATGKCHEHCPDHCPWKIDPTKEPLIRLHFENRSQVMWIRLYLNNLLDLVIWCKTMQKWMKKSTKPYGRTIVYPNGSQMTLWIVKTGVVILKLWMPWFITENWLSKIDQ